MVVGDETDKVWEGKPTCVKPPYRTNPFVLPIHDTGRRGSRARVRHGSALGWYGGYGGTGVRGLVGGRGRGRGEAPSIAARTVCHGTDTPHFPHTPAPPRTAHLTSGTHLVAVYP